jgi:hypothetical protein
MGQILLMFTWTDVRNALETLSDTSHRRKAAWLVERLKQDSEGLTPSALLTEIISSAVLLGAEQGREALGRQSLLDG